MQRDVPAPDRDLRERAVERWHALPGKVIDNDAKVRKTSKICRASIAEKTNFCMYLCHGDYF